MANLGCNATNNGVFDIPQANRRTAVCVKKQPDHCIVSAVLFEQFVNGVLLPGVLFEQDGVTPLVGYSWPFDKAVCPTQVKVCDTLGSVGAPPPPPPAPVSVVAETCTGTTNVLANAVPQQIVNVAGTALLVKLCPVVDGQQSRDFVVLCAPNGLRVAVQNVTPANAPLTTPPTFEAWNLDGTPYVGQINDLVDCGAEKVDVGTSQFYCSENFGSVTRTDFFTVNTSPIALLGTIWQQVGGQVIASAGALGTISAGACPEAVGADVAVEQAYHECIAGECVEFIRRTYTNNTFVWVTSNGTVYTPTTLTSALVGGCGCLRAVERPVCVNFNDGEIVSVYDAIERIQYNCCGAIVGAPVYLDADQSPMQNVTPSVVSIRHGGACDCVRDAPLPAPTTRSIGWGPYGSASLNGGVDNFLSIGRLITGSFIETTLAPSDVITLNTTWSPIATSGFPASAQNQPSISLSGFNILVTTNVITGGLSTFDCSCGIFTINAAVNGVACLNQLVVTAIPDAFYGNLSWSVVTPTTIITT